VLEKLFKVIKITFIAVNFALVHYFIFKVLSWALIHLNSHVPSADEILSITEINLS